ncbi:MAG: HU family DNA-binding protein [Clostridiales bacterium]|nr:HU family DNA-binding protein [Clostridiales bacterium]
MNKAELVSAMATKSGLSKKDCEAALNALVDTTQRTLAKGGKVILVGFGTFEVRKRSERRGRNPRTGAEMIIPASKVPSFKAGKKFKVLVNK